LQARRDFDDQRAVVAEINVAIRRDERTGVISGRFDATGEFAQVTALPCGFNRSTQQIDEIVELVSRSLVFSSDVR
jgi:hypothetical protein